eukprot:292322-Chlamydomonas_euryale.AAC.5
MRGLISGGQGMAARGESLPGSDMAVVWNTQQHKGAVKPSHLRSSAKYVSCAQSPAHSATQCLTARITAATIRKALTKYVHQRGVTNALSGTFNFIHCPSLVCQFGWRLLQHSNLRPTATPTRAVCIGRLNKPATCSASASGRPSDVGTDSWRQSKLRGANWPLTTLRATGTLAAAATVAAFGRGRRQSRGRWASSVRSRLVLGAVDAAVATATNA